MLGIFGLCPNFVSNALLHLFHAQCVSRTPSLAFPPRHGENGSVATIWCLASVFKLQISSLWESATLLTQDVSATMFFKLFLLLLALHPVSPADHF
jgi:hypothetical protein